MDKICIVKRRRKNHYEEPLWGTGVPLVLDGPQEEKDTMITLPLIPGDSQFIPVAEPEKGTLKILSAIAIDQPTFEEGQVTFNFRLKTEDTLKMLKPDQVCHLLQISKHFLSKLVKTRKVRSYKFGRLRRFLLADIIDYLTVHQDPVVSRGPSKKEQSVLFPNYSN